MTSNTFLGVMAILFVVLAIRGFLQVYNPTVRSGGIRVSSVSGRGFWMPLWWRPFTRMTTVAFGTSALAYLAVLVFSQ